MAALDRPHGDDRRACLQSIVGHARKCRGLLACLAVQTLLTGDPVIQQRRASPLHSLDSLCDVLPWPADAGLRGQELVPALLADFAQVFTTAEVFTPLDLAALGSQWPSIHDMLAEGKRILVVSGVDYLTPMAPLIFSRCSATGSLPRYSCPCCLSCGAGAKLVLCMAG